MEGGGRLEPYLAHALSQFQRLEDTDNTAAVLGPECSCVWTRANE